MQIARSTWRDLHGAMSGVWLLIARLVAGNLGASQSSKW
jgi:hypothetical protein